MPRAHAKHFRPVSSAFTLLEVLLALALSVLVLATLAMSIDFYLRVVDKGRIEVEQAQLARAVLGRIAEDLRSTVRGVTVDTSALSALASSSGVPSGDELNKLLGQTGGQQGSSTQGTSGQPNSTASGLTSGANNSQGGAGTKSGTGGGNSSGKGGGNSSGSGGNSGNAPSNSSNPASSNPADAAKSNSASGTSNSSGSQSPSTSPSTSTTPPAVPGLYGNEHELQVDVSRLPRPDEYAPATDSQEAFATAAPHDVRTVAYYLGNESSAASSMPTTGTTSTGGLVRRQVNRAVALFNGQQAADTTGQDTVNLAPEVTSVEFRYLDGQSWVTTWDSETAGRLPNAVEVSVEISPPGQRLSAVEAASRALFDSNTSNRAPVIYRLIVYLPASDITPPPETSTEEDPDAPPM